MKASYTPLFKKVTKGLSEGFLFNQVVIITMVVEKMGDCASGGIWIWYENHTQ